MNKEAILRDMLLKDNAANKDLSKLKVKMLGGCAPVLPQKPKPNPNFISVLRPEGVPIVDRVQQIIKYHQDNFISLRTVALRSVLYDKFWAYFNNRSIAQGLGEIPNEMRLKMFDVDITKGTPYQKTDMYFEAYWPKDTSDSFFSSRVRKPYEC